VDRAVIDPTGLDDWYDIGFDYTPDETTPGWRGGSRPDGTPVLLEPPTSGPNIFKALENLGLKLEPTKWPMPYLVIDRAEKPRPNVPVPASADATAGKPGGCDESERRCSGPVRDGTPADNAIARGLEALGLHLE